MAETPLHRAEMTYAIESLLFYFADRADVYVSGNDFVYWERGNPKAVVSPDCYVVFGVNGSKRRDCYKAWEENGKLPDIVIECTSKKTLRDDTRIKKPLYEQVLVGPEYFQFDPTSEYLRPPLQGVRLADGVYAAIVPENGRLHSEQLNLDLTIEEGHLRFLDPITGEKLLTYNEYALRSAEQEYLTQVERRRAETAESENARLREELAALRRASGQGS